MPELEVKSSRGKKIASWVLAVLLAAAFLGAGGAKFAGAAPMVAAFAKIGIGQWFRFVTGSLEVIGGIGVLIPRLRFPAAILLCLVMLGAIGFTLTVLGGSPVPPIILLVLSAATAWLTRPTWETGGNLNKEAS